MSCAPRAKKALEKLDGVQQVTVDFKSKKATVVMKEGKTLTKEQVEDALDEEGFEVGSFEEASDGEEDSHQAEAKEDASSDSCWKCEQGHIQSHKGKKGQCVQCGNVLQKSECPEGSTFEDLNNKVCPMMDEEVSEDSWIIYDGKKIHFCCEGCEEDFMEAPEKHLKGMKEEKKDSGNKEPDKNKHDKHKHHHKH